MRRPWSVAVPLFYGSSVGLRRALTCGRLVGGGSTLRGGAARRWRASLAWAVLSPWRTPAARRAGRLPLGDTPNDGWGGGRSLFGVCAHLRMVWQAFPRGGGWVGYLSAIRPTMGGRWSVFGWRVRPSAQGVAGIPARRRSLGVPRLLAGRRAGFTPAARRGVQRRLS